MRRGGWVAPDSKKQRLIYLEANKATPAKSNTPLNLWNVCHGVLLLCSHCSHLYLFPESSVAEQKKSLNDKHYLSGKRVVPIRDFIGCTGPL